MLFFGLPQRVGLKGMEGDFGAYMKAMQTRLGELGVWESIGVRAVARRVGVRGCAANVLLRTLHCTRL